MPPCTSVARLALERKRSTASPSGSTVQNPSPTRAARLTDFGPNPQTTISGGGSGRRRRRARPGPPPPGGGGMAGLPPQQFLVGLAAWGQVSPQDVLVES